MKKNILYIGNIKVIFFNLFSIFLIEVWKQNCMNYNKSKKNPKKIII